MTTTPSEPSISAPAEPPAAGTLAVGEAQPPEALASTPSSRAMLFGALAIAIIGIIGIPLLVMFGMQPTGPSARGPLQPVDPSKARTAPNYVPSVARGEGIYRRVCASCHTIDGRRYTGPTFKGLYESEVPLRDGTTVIADEVYLRESILDPNAAITAGYQPAMLSYANSLQPDEIEDVIAFIKSLK